MADKSEDVARDKDAGAGEPRRHERHPKLQRLLDRLDRPFRFAGRLTLVSLAAGVLGTVVGSFFQYTSWREEQNLARYKEDFAKATDTFAEVSATLASAMNLQQLLYFGHKQTVEDNTDGSKETLQYKSTSKLYDDYFTARSSLRRNIDVIARKMEIFVDWPSVSEPQLSSVLYLLQDPVVPKPVAAADSDTLNLAGFDCSKHMPNFSRNDFGLIDWYSTKHHVVTFYHCLERIHYRLYATRIWASGAEVKPDDRAEFQKNMTKIEEMLNEQIARLNAFMVLAMRRIEDIRQKNRPRGFVCHYTLYWCGPAKDSATPATPPGS